MSAPALLFSPDIDWSGRWKESLSWVTDMITSDNDSEQRILVRDAAKPRRTVEYLAKAINPRASALLDNLVFAEQPSPIGVPLWPDVVQLASSAASTATSLAIDTTYGGTALREFVADGFAALWTDPFTWEIVTVSSVPSSASLSVSALTAAWPAGTRVVPVTVGTLAPTLTRSRRSGAINQMPVKFACNPLVDTPLAITATVGPSFAATWPPAVNPAPNPGIAFTMVPDRGQAVPASVPRSMILEDSIAGPFTYYAPSATPRIAQTQRYFLNGRTAIATFKCALWEFAGRCYAFTTPTWQADLTLAVAALSTDQTLTIQSCGYTKYAFSPGRVNLVAILATTSGPTFTPLAVNSTVDNGDGTETLTLSAAIGVALPLGTLICYNLGARLGEDTVMLEYSSAGLARASLPIVELPLTAVVSGGSGGGGTGGGSGTGGGPAVGNVAIIGSGPNWLSASIPALAGTIPGLADLELRMWFLSDWILDSLAAGNATDWVGGVYVTDSAQSNKTMYASLAVPTLTPAGTIQFVLWGMGITLDGIYAGYVSVNISALPAAGTVMILDIRYDATTGFQMSLWDSTGVQYGSTLTAGPGTGATPAGNTSLWIGGSGANLVANMYVDCIELRTSFVSDITALPLPAGDDPAVIELVTYDGRNLTALTGVNLTASGPQPVLYQTGGVAGTS